jgi:hypothetical protein
MLGAIEFCSYVTSWHKLHLVEVVLRLAGCFYVRILLNLWDLWAMLVVMAVGVAAFWADVFHGCLVVLAGLWGRDWRTVQPSFAG